MLVLSRKHNQSIRFPSLGISVNVVRIAGKAVRLGVTAPDDVKVLREELCGEDDSAELNSQRRELRHRFSNDLNHARLGLALAEKQLERGLSQDAGKTIASAISALDRLERFTDTLPFGKVPDSVAPQPTTNPETHARRALVVEDNNNERELLAGYLRLSGFQVDTASDGLEAIKYLSRTGHNLPQVILLDMMMPKLDGPKTVSNIRIRPEMSGIQLYAVSGKSPEEMSVAVGPTGVDRWFQKPINPEALVRHIDAAMNELKSGYVWPLGVTFHLPSRFRDFKPSDAAVV